MVPELGKWPKWAKTAILGQKRRFGAFWAPWGTFGGVQGGGLPEGSARGGSARGGLLGGVLGGVLGGGSARGGRPGGPGPGPGNFGAQKSYGFFENFAFFCDFQKSQKSRFFAGTVGFWGGLGRITSVFFSSTDPRGQKKKLRS